MSAFLAGIVVGVIGSFGFSLVVVLVAAGVIRSIATLGDQPPQVSNE